MYGLTRMPHMWAPKRSMWWCVSNLISFDFEHSLPFVSACLSLCLSCSQSIRIFRLQCYHFIWIYFSLCSNLIVCVQTLKFICSVWLFKLIHDLIETNRIVKYFESLVFFHLEYDYRCWKLNKKAVTFLYIRCANASS